MDLTGFKTRPSLKRPSVNWAIIVSSKITAIPAAEQFLLAQG